MVRWLTTAATNLRPRKILGSVWGGPTRSCPVPTAADAGARSQRPHRRCRRTSDGTWAGGVAAGRSPKQGEQTQQQEEEELAIAKSCASIGDARSPDRAPPSPRTPLAMTLQALLLLAVLVTAALADSVTDELAKNGLPVGLLPSSVKSYAITPAGQFSLSLDAPCYAKIDDQLAYYSQNITGKLKYGAISNLDGIETKQLFVWLPVTGIYVDVPATPYIYFEVGVLTKRLALAVFETPIKCNAHHVETGFHIPSWAANSAVAGSRPRKALQ